jgi:predicted transposase YbfD/YdcC
VILEALQRWLYEAGGSGGRIIPIDGKTVRGSGGGEETARHIISAFVSGAGITLAQIKTEEKANEITEIPKLLDSIDIEGDTVTIDAMGCQRDIAAKITEKGGDYVLAVKENQPRLYEDIKEYFEWLDKEKPEDEPYVEWKSGSEKDHGRIERREIRASEAIEGWLDPEKRWKGLKSIVRCRGYRWEKGVETVFDRYYISSRSADAEALGRCIRAHWEIENNLHWVLDVIFNEDRSKIRTGFAPEVFNVMKKAVIALIKQREPDRKKSYKLLMLKALLNDNYREYLLFGKK